MRVHTTIIPLFGKCFLIPHEVADEPTVSPLVGYVDFGNDNRLVAAIWRNSRWTDHRKRPFDQPIVRWYHMEKLDGSKLFGD